MTGADKSVAGGGDSGGGDGETVVESFAPDRGAFLRDNAWLAAIAMAGGMVVLWAVGNPAVWTGAVGGLAAIAIRAWYLSDEELAARWDLTATRLLGPNGRTVRLREIAQVNRIFSMVQIVTTGGDKHLIKYQADPVATRRRLDAARVGGRA